MQAKTEERNQFVDIMRGIAMLLVVLGHTMTGCTVDSQKSFLFNIVWSLQMPLFILISGYVTKYSRSICDNKDLGKYVKRRIVSYMLPWVVWSFLIRGFLFGESNWLKVKWLLWHMDSGYWFLATIWTISMIFGVASYLAERIGKSSEIKKQISLLLCYLAGMVLLVGIGMVMGLSFFAIKLTLYYMPFYYAGYLYGQVDDKILSTDKGKKVTDCCVAMCFAIWIFVIVRFPLYEMSDSGLAIILRAATSLAGCIAVCGLCSGIFSDKIGGGIAWIGVHSLEVYLTHYLLLNLIKVQNSPAIYSPEGLGLVLINYIVTVILVMIMIMAVNKNKTLKFVLMGKKN